jgi:hypothetical protein
MSHSLAAGAAEELHDNLVSEHPSLLRVAERRRLVGHLFGPLKKKQKEKRERKRKEKKEGWLSLGC